MRQSTASGLYLTLSRASIKAAVTRVRVQICPYARSSASARSTWKINIQLISRKKCLLIVEKMKKKISEIEVYQ